MQIISYRTTAQEPWRAGIEQDGQVVPATVVYTFDTQTHTVRALLEAGQDTLATTLAKARRLLEAGAHELLPLQSLQLGPAIPDPDKIICVGLNYADHAAESHMELPKVPVLFPKFRNSLIGAYDDIVLPGFSTQIDYEAELAVIIGRTAKDVSEQDALKYVAGYCAMNDVSARDWQFLTNQWMIGKAIDTFGPLGPGIVPATDIPDPQDLKVIARVNGQVLQNGTTREMIFSVAKCVSFISQVMTLVPGDVISTGTPAGVGQSRKPPIFLRDGDVVEVEVEHIGSLKNKVVGANAR